MELNEFLVFLGNYVVSPRRLYRLCCWWMWNAFNWYVIQTRLRQNIKDSRLKCLSILVASNYEVVIAVGNVKFTISYHWQPSVHWTVRSQSEPRSYCTTRTLSTKAPGYYSDAAASRRPAARLSFGWLLARRLLLAEEENDCRVLSVQRKSWRSPVTDVCIERVLGVLQVADGTEIWSGKKRHESGILR